MIEAHSLVKSFDGAPALRGLDLHVPRGAVYGLVGPNGAGKSTLLRHLSGVYHQDSGSVCIDGQPVWENTALKQRVQSIPDDLFYFLQAGVREMAAFYRGVYRGFDPQRFAQLQEAFPPWIPKRRCAA